MSVRGGSSSSGGAGGTVTNVSSANADIAVATGSTTPVLTLNSGTGANQIVKLNGSSQLPAVSGVLLTGVEKTANKDASGGYVGLTLLKINFKNVLGTFISFFTNSNTAARTYTFPDTSGTVALLSDVPTNAILKDGSVPYDDAVVQQMPDIASATVLALMGSQASITGAVDSSQMRENHFRVTDGTDAAVLQKTQLSVTDGTDTGSYSKSDAILTDGTNTALLTKNAIQIGDGTDTTTLSKTALQIGDVTDDVLVDKFSIRQKSAILGNNSHVIGGAVAGVAVLDATQYVETLINGVPVKLAVIV